MSPKLGPRVFTKIKEKRREGFFSIKAEESIRQMFEKGFLTAFEHATQRNAAWLTSERKKNT